MQCCKLCVRETKNSGVLLRARYRSVFYPRFVTDRKHVIRNAPRTRIIRAVIPSLQGDAATQSPPDLPSFIFQERIVYLGMTLVPSVTELILAELLYLQYEDKKKPIQLYINSTGSSKDGKKYGYDSEAFAIYDTIQYVSPPVHTIAVGTAWGEAAMLLASGSKGQRAALPSASIMLKQPLSSFRGQASELEIQRQEMRNTKKQMLDILAKTTGRDIATIETDINRPLYFEPSEAIKYGLIDKVLMQ
ncbi:Clp protease proteolytic subunit /Translocation-enhancing protein TepA [Ostreococcus tauri]|uniref:ATP-dependent Clp protease proteolytic subunit n=1 Tax=Ostreococcus tauri TaxID=70448 RepID=A0A090M7A1_OSTTA|nr:Clp protease proteolytic subunit /Translocation-enhancing protein TepA [Ostreococcus tauri]CEG00918.1 Clp protease proteolytic subunit /Translocation-enhancing protein TepA [Ostreococcus tauri]|eukprot:XP_022840668.1 Clp protease proteolytic subunit /Translocation-enhancing protein TepA [Ostreococcus tauri]